MNENVNSQVTQLVEMLLDAAEYDFELDTELLNEIDFEDELS